MPWQMRNRPPEDPRIQIDTAQICVNGHVITAHVHTQPEFCEEFCTRCGEQTIVACQSCKKQIRGLPPWMMIRYKAPAFCHACGKPYPWTSRTLEAAKAYAQDLQSLTGEERVQLALSLDDLVRDTPMAPVSANHFKRLVAKAGREAPGFFKDLLVELVSETVKKVIWGPAA